MSWPKSRDISFVPFCDTAQLQDGQPETAIRRERERTALPLSSENLIFAEQFRTKMNSEENRTAGDGLPMPRRLWAILAVAFGVSLSVLDATLSNVALPTIARQLGVSEADSIWVVNAYQLATVVTLLSFSALAEIVGFRRVYIGGLALFTAASLGCALSRTLPSLILFRLAQGIGASAVTSINTTLIRIIYPSRQLGRGLGINATVVAASSVAGPTIAAAVLSLAPWQWLFAINLPIGAAAIALGWFHLPANPMKSNGRKFDWRDGAMNGLTFGLLIASIEGSSHGLDPKWVAAGLLLLFFVGRKFVREQLKKEHPILPFDLLRIPIFAVSAATSVSSYLAQMTGMVALPFFLQHALHYNAVDTGLIMTAWPAVIMVAAPLAGWLVERIHAGWLGGIGLLTMGCGLLSLLVLPDHPTEFDLIWRLALTGSGFGLFQSPNNSILIASAPPRRSGSASGMLASARLVGQTTGAALVAALFHLYDPIDGCRIALLTAAAFAFAGSIISFSRLRLPLPEALRPKR